MHLSQLVCGCVRGCSFIHFLVRAVISILDLQNELQECPLSYPSSKGISYMLEIAEI